MPTLRDKFNGCIAASWVGSAMGAAVEGGLAGALSGAEAIPSEWIAQVNEATRQDPYTNCRRTIEETADGLHRAFCARLDRLESYAGLMRAEGYLG